MKPGYIFMTGGLALGGLALIGGLPIWQAMTEHYQLHPGVVIGAVVAVSGLISLLVYYMPAWVLRQS